MGLKLRVFAVVLLLALLADAALWWRAERWNAAIAAGDVAEDSQQAPLRFARAHAAAARGDDDAALALYRGLQADPALGSAARFNSANILMRQAGAAAQPGQAIALLELAKEVYRELLRHDPDHWDARYNLERAQRLLPDVATEDPVATEAPKDRERAATTMRAQSMGLP